MRTARGKLHIVLFVIGLTMLISGVAIAIGGPYVMFRWQSYSEVLAEDAPLEVRDCYIDAFGWLTPGREAYAHSSPPQMSRDAIDIKVEGNITAEGDYRFNFVVLNWWEWRAWREGGYYSAYVEARNVTSFSFMFNLTKRLEIGFDDFYFGVENWNDYDIRTRLSATISWKEKEVVEPVIATMGLFTLGKLTGVVGLILMIVAAVVKLGKLGERPYRAPGS